MFNQDKYNYMYYRSTTRLLIQARNEFLFSLSPKELFKELGFGDLK